MLDKKDDINQIESIWKRLYKNNPNNFIFQSFEWMLYVQNRYDRSLYFKKHWKYKYFVFIINGKNVIVPIIINEKEKKLKLMGEFTPTDYQDFIYDNISQEDINIILEELKNEFKGYDFIINRINERSILAKYLDKLDGEKVLHTCVKLEIIQDFDTYFKTLHKNFRQNIRTNYNRIQKAGSNYRLEVLPGNKLNEKLLQQLFCIYNTRKERKLGNIHGINKLKQEILRIFKLELKHDMLFQYLKKQENSNVWILWIDNNIAAFMVGLSSKRNEVLIPRLAINPDFYFYGPGNILIMEFLKQNKTYKVLDLTRGDEAYKFNCGGIVHQNYEITIHL